MQENEKLVPARSEVNNKLGKDRRSADFADVVQCLSASQFKFLEGDIKHV